MHFGSSMFANRKLALFTTCAALLVTLSASAALFFVYPPSSYPLLKPYSQHAADWWKWALTQPVATSPLLDTTGAQCNAGQPRLGAFYLAGALDSTPVLRTCTVPAARTLVFPVINAAYFAFASDPAEQKTEAFLRSQVSFVEQATALEVEIDGVAVPNVARFLERSVLFSVTLPADNVFELPAGFVLSPSVDSGYYLAVAPLIPGHHTLHFHGALPDGSTQDVTYDLNVRAF